MKLAIMQLVDQGPAESTAEMLRAVGYDVYLPDKALRDELRRIGCDTVLSARDLKRGMGYDMPDIPEIGLEAMQRCDLFCDIKAHRSYDRIVGRWPNLKGKVLWTRINGGKPEHVIKSSGEDCGDEVNPPCPVLTPNMWYRDSGPTAYACWPPFVRLAEYATPRSNRYAAPICLLHNFTGWGYGALVEPMRSLGVTMYGAGSPDGLIQHREVITRLASAKCMVHLKSSDAPGYALYEALAAACPVVCTRRLIWRCRMQDLLIPGETCLVFDRETHEGLTPEDVAECTREVRDHLAWLSVPENNRRLGEAGRQRLLSVMWSKDKPEDVASLREFMARNFPA